MVCRMWPLHYLLCMTDLTSCPLHYKGHHCFGIYSLLNFVCLFSISQVEHVARDQLISAVNLLHSDHTVRIKAFATITLSDCLLCLYRRKGRLNCG